jgi:hypothetical protein
MSVFRNLGIGDPIEGTNYADWVVSVGVARGLDDEIRIALRGKDHDDGDGEVLLTYANVKRLIARLQEAIADE